MHCRKRTKEMQDRKRQRYKLLLDRGSGLRDCEAVQGCELQNEREEWRNEKECKKHALVFIAAAGFWGTSVCPSTRTVVPRR